MTESFSRAAIRAGIALWSPISANARSALMRALCCASPGISNRDGTAGFPITTRAFRARSETSVSASLKARMSGLMAALEDDSVMMQHWAEEGLERLGLNMVYLKPE